MNESNEVPTYQPPEGVHGPTLGRDLPDGCERLMACYSPAMHLTWEPVDHDPGTGGFVYWWRFPPLQVGDRVQLTGTVVVAPKGGWPFVAIDGDHDDERPFPTDALTRVVTP